MRGINQSRKPFAAPRFKIGINAWSKKFTKLPLATYISMSNADRRLSDTHYPIPVKSRNRWVRLVRSPLEKQAGGAIMDTESRREIKRSLFVAAVLTSVLIAGAGIWALANRRASVEASERSSSHVTTANIAIDLDDPRLSKTLEPP